jgi:uncharacterized Zn finger protein
VTGAPAPIRHAAPLSCPSCGCSLTGHWLSGRDSAAQQCGACGHVFEAIWPGFTFEPETVIARPSGEEPGRGAG